MLNISEQVNDLIELLWEDVQDNVILDVVQSVHRQMFFQKKRLDTASGGNASQGESKRQKQCAADDRQRPLAQTHFVPLPAQRGSKGPVDVFGQSHPAKATEVVMCKNCSRPVQAGMFAPHLEKCMGKGRAAGRAASKRIQAQTRLDQA